MGRHRKHDVDLPKNLYHRKGGYYYVAPYGKWVKLSEDKDEALRLYAEKEAHWRAVDRPPTIEEVGLAKALIEEVPQFTGIGPGVYMLLKAGEVIYVGSSLSVPARIEAHKADKDFDRVISFGVESHRRLEVEYALIATFRPRLNKEGNDFSGSVRKSAA